MESVRVHRGPGLPCEHSKRPAQNESRAPGPHERRDRGAPRGFAVTFRHSHTTLFFGAPLLHNRKNARTVTMSVRTQEAPWEIQ